MAKRGKKDKQSKKPYNAAEGLDDAYDACMADIYDILIKAYDQIGVRVQELLDEPNTKADLNEVVDYKDNELDEEDYLD